MYLEMTGGSIDCSIEGSIGEHAIRIRTQRILKLLHEFRSQQVGQMRALDLSVYVEGECESSCHYPLSR